MKNIKINKTIIRKFIDQLEIDNILSYEKENDIYGLDNYNFADYFIDNGILDKNIAWSDYYISEDLVSFDSEFELFEFVEKSIYNHIKDKLLDH